ncbi:MAG: TRAP transporter large permease [Gracilibacteraceae bacterium]|jgi:tripartite ATP-independent transporter DctM subunit|nr:TRAP transporter large permease [Gracilibacteraceae bacterium]
MSVIVVVSILLLIFLLIIGISVPASFFAVVMYLVVAGHYDPSVLMPYSYSRLSSYVLLAIPLFVIAGGVIEKSGIGAHLVDFVNLLIGRVKGSLGIVAVASCALFGSVTGSATATMTVIGSIMWPRMDAAGYNKGKSAALIASCCLLGGLIPPSSLMIVYAWISQQSVIACFLAIFLPGVMMTVMFSIAYYFMVRHDTGMDVMEKMPKDVYVARLKKTGISFIPAAIFPFIILGGIYSGIMTPTESASVSLIYALLVGFLVYRSLSLKSLGPMLVSSASTIGVVMVMIFMVMMLSRIYIMENLPDSMLDVINSVSQNRFVVLCLVNIFMIIVGMLMDDVSAMLLAVPLLLPIVDAVGVDRIHFAAIVAVNISLGCVTPPCAPLTYLAARLSNTPVAAMMKPTFFLILVVWLPALIIVTYVPQLSLFLPHMAGR